MYGNPSVVTLLLLCTFIFFSVSLYRRIAIVSVGQPENRFDYPWRRLQGAFIYGFGQKRVAAKPFGFNHIVIFVSFLLLLPANTEFFLRGVFPALSFSNLPPIIAGPLMFVFDFASLLALIAIVIAAIRRVVQPPYPEGRTAEAFFILSLIGLLMVAYLVLHGAEIAGGREPLASFMPVSKALSLAIGHVTSTTIAKAAWWAHLILLLVFVSYLPHSKHLHIVTAIPNCFFRSLERGLQVTRENFRTGNHYGAEKVTDFAWKDLFDSLSCTECGRCQAVCPATATGKSLNPREMLHRLKENLRQNAPQLRKGEAATQCIGTGKEQLPEDAIWACTTCGACMEVCPVFIEHIGKLVKLRRHLVQMESKFPEELLNLFENAEQRSNPWGIAPSERAKWASAMDVKTFEAGKTEYLLFVGCAGSFDSRSKHVTVALASILDAAGVSWGILGKEERCCGDSLRRLGNEFIFDRMATENVALFKNRGVTKVITQCPHCFTTLANDYRQFGIELEVVHHSQFIASLIDDGKLKFKDVPSTTGRIVFHDSCYLGRHNNIYEAPRRILTYATNSAPLDMARSFSNSFCCGAGGGRMWMDEHEGTRINIDRVIEALSMEPDIVCVSCPYCLTMFEDGLKEREATQVQVKDIAEVVAGCTH